MSFGRVLLIGNSHLAAPRNALRDWPERWPDFRPDIFGLPGRGIGELELRDGVLLSDDPEIRRQINFYNEVPALAVTGYDAFVVVGGSSFAQLCSVQTSHRSLGFPSVAAGIPCELCSEGFMDAMVRRRILASTAMRLIRRLARLGIAPILFLPAPLPSAECRDDPQQEQALLQLFRRGDGASFHQRYLHHLHELMSDLAVVIEQPPDTMVHEVFTRSEWMRGSLRLNSRQDVQHGRAEYSHGNTRFGARRIDQILAGLQAL